MAGTGHIGTHMGILLYEWNYRYVAPYLLHTATAQSADRERTRASASAAPAGASSKSAGNPPPDEAVKPASRDPFYRSAPTSKPADGRPLRRLEPPPVSRLQDEIPARTAPGP
jgi:hypothetical protein